MMHLNGEQQMYRFIVKRKYYITYFTEQLLRRTAFNCVVLNKLYCLLSQPPSKSISMKSGL